MVARCCLSTFFFWLNNYVINWIYVLGGNLHVSLLLQALLRYVNSLGAGLLRLSCGNYF